jgi:hypothetical protein
MRSHVLVVLKSGVSIEFDAIDPEVKKGWRGTLAKLDWTRPDDWRTDLLYLKREEAAAVIITRREDAGGEASPESPPSPKG